MSYAAEHASGRSRRALAVIVAVLSIAGASVRVSTAGPAPAPPGPRLAVVLINFRNESAEPFTPTQARAWTYTADRSVASLYREASYGALDLTGDVFGWRTLDLDNGPTCDFGAWEDAAAADLARDGIDLGGYDSVIYAAPRVAACDFVGITVPGERRTFVNGPVTARQWLVVAGHELGHVFGAEHAHALTCRNGAGETVSLSDSCEQQYYGDPFDIMGQLNAHLPNGNHLAAMGLLPVGSDVTVASTGDYRLGPLETTGADPRLLRIPYDRDADGDVRSLLLEFRQPSRFDDFAPGAPVVNGVTVRLGKDPRLHAATYLVDATPETAGDFSDAPLLQGASLSIPEHRITIKVTNVDASGAAVHVESLGLVDNWADCDGVTVPDRVAAGKQTPVEVRLVNTGNTVWSPDAGHRVVTRGAAGDLYLAPGTEVAPGAVGSFTGAFMAPNQLGPLPLVWRGQQGDLPFGDDCSATVEVVKDVNPPSTPSDLHSTVRSQTSLELAWAASTDDSAVTGYRVYRSTDGSSFDLLTATAALSVVDDGLAAGKSYWYRVEAFDESRNVSPPTPALVVTVPDITAPSAPTGLTAFATGRDTVQLRWSPSTDNLGVVGYRIYRRGLDSPLYTLAGETTGPSFRDRDLGFYLYTYYVLAVDAAGNASARSNEPMVLTCLADGVCL